MVGHFVPTRCCDLLWYLRRALAYPSIPKACTYVSQRTQCSIFYEETRWLVSPKLSEKVHGKQTSI